MESAHWREAGGGSGARYWWTLLVGAVLFTVLRVPSFFEPHWYTDEAGYLTTARGMLRGEVLYAQVWNNKPPLQLWTVALLLKAFGSGEWALHGLTYLFGLIALAALAYAASRLLSPVRAVVAVVLGGILLGAPIVGSELIIPENFLIAPTAWAGAVLLTRVRGGGRWWPVAVGALAAAAVAYQQTALADAAAFAAIIVFAAPWPMRSLVVYLTTLVLGTALWLVPSVLLAGFSHVAFALVGFYVGFTTMVLPTTHFGLLLRAALLLSATGLALLGAYLLRSQPVVTWATWFWAIATGLIVGAAQQPYGHYLIPAIVPLALALASVPLPRPRSWRVRPAAGAAAIVGAAVIATMLATIVEQDWMLYQFWVRPYYVGFAGVVTGRESLASWQDGFDVRVASDREVANWIRAHHLQGTRTVVWSSDAWLYLEADLPLLLPTAPIYNDEDALFGENGQTAQHVAQLNPVMIVTATGDLATYPDIKPLLARRYHLVFRSGADSVWLRDGTTVPQGP
jgi:Dolichyl-phosphate-mannose-protein mannosyltransferase